MVSRFRARRRRDLGVAVTSFSFVIPLQPVAASRAKVSRYGTYYPAKHNAYRSECIAFLKSLVVPPPWPLLKPERLTVRLDYHMRKAKTSRLSTPREDIDNLIKLTLDCITSSERFWKDDTQVDVVLARKIFISPGEQPTTHIQIKRSQ